MNQACWKALSVVCDIPVPSGQQPGWKPCLSLEGRHAAHAELRDEERPALLAGITLKIVRTSA